MHTNAVVINVLLDTSATKSQGTFFVFFVQVATSKGTNNIIDFVEGLISILVCKAIILYEKVWSPFLNTKRRKMYKIWNSKRDKCTIKIKCYCEIRLLFNFR